MITTIDGKAAIVDQSGCFCEESFRDLRVRINITHV